MTVEPQAADSRPGPRLLLVEDDAADALLFEELLAQTGSDFELAHVTDLSDAISAVELLGPAACVLDLGLPGCQDLEALEHLQSRFETLPIVVLTGRSDEAVGARAVSMGAQDYLLKGHESGASVLRSIRFAIERCVAEQHAAALQLERARADEQVRMESALLGQAETVANGCRWSSRYVAARDGVVGGDFIDCVELGNDRVRMVVGDVAGHGPDEAALGVALRVAWRTLALVVPAELDLLAPLEVLLLSERRDGADFATVLDVVRSPSRRQHQEGTAMKNMSRALGALVAAAACVAMLAPTAGASPSTQAANRPFIEVHTANLSRVDHDPAADGGSNVGGRVTFVRVGDNLVVLEYVTGAAADLPHAQHVHGVGIGQCPDPSRRDARGLISTPAAIPDYGSIQASLTTRGDTSPASALAVTRFPVSTFFGGFVYIRTLKIGRDIPAEVGYNIEDYEVVVHGIDINHDGAYDFSSGPSPLDPSIPFEATIPAACGQIN